VVSQLALLEPAPANWARAYQRLALEDPVSAERAWGGTGGTSFSSVVSIFGLGVAAIVGLNAWSAWQRAEWLTIALWIGGLLAAMILALAAYLRFGRSNLYDPKLV